MRRVQRVAQQHVIAIRPALVAHQRKPSPDRIVGDQRMAAECIGKNALAYCARVLLAHLCKAGALKGWRIDFDDKGAQIRRKTIMMRVEMTEIGRDKGLRQRPEALAGAKPGETIGEIEDDGARLLRVSQPEQ